MQYHVYLCTFINKVGDTGYRVAVREELEREFASEEEVKQLLLEAPLTIDVLLAKCDDSKIGWVRHSRSYAKKLKLTKEYILVKNVNECVRCAGTGYYPGYTGVNITRMHEQGTFCFSCKGSGLN